MMRLEDRPGQRRAVLFGLAGFIVAASVLGFWALARMVTGWELVKVSWIFAFPLALALLAFFQARKQVRAPRVLLLADAHGVSILGAAPVSWEGVAAVMSRTARAGNGPMDVVGIRSQHGPDTAGNWAQKILRNALSDRSFAPAMAGQSAQVVLEGLDVEMAKAGYRRGTAVVKKRGGYRTSIWPLEATTEADADASCAAPSFP